MWLLWRIDFLTSTFNISLISSKERVFIPFLMSLNNCSVKVIKEVDTNNVSQFLTFLSETWNCFLPPKMEMRSCGTQPRKWKYRWEPYFRGTKWVFFIWTFQQSVTKLWLFSVTKLRLLLLVVQYRVCFYLRVRINNLMILVIYPIWGGGKWSRWEE